MATYISAGMLAMAMTASTASADGLTMHVLLAGRSRAVVVAAIAGAVERLETPACRRLLTDFADENGRSLAETLAATGLTLPFYVSRLFVVEGDGERACANARIRMFTAPGSHVIHVCSAHFAAVSDIANAQLTFIHEILHTLGLGENPPSTDYISRQVTRRCRASL